MNFKIKTNILFSHGPHTVNSALLPTQHNCRLSQSTSLRLMSYNVRHGLTMSASGDEPYDKQARIVRRNLPRQARVISAQQPDLVGLQEIDNNCTRSGTIDEAHKYGSLTGLYHRFGAFEAFEGGLYGMAMLSRFPLGSNVTEVKLPDGECEPRIALVYDLQLPSTRLLFVNVHLDWVRDPVWRLRQAFALLRFLNGQRSALPCVIVGDFNAERRSATLQLFQKAGFTDVPKVNGDKTWNARHPTIEIDNILVRGSSEVAVSAEPVRVIDEPEASDHRPIATTISLSTNSMAC